MTLMLAICQHGAAQTTESHSFLNLNRSVPDGNAAGLSDMRSLNSAIADISNVRVKLNIAGEFNGDLFGYLRHIQEGVTNFCVLLNRPGRSASNLSGYADAGMNVIFDDAASGTDIHNYRSATNLPPGSPLTGTWQTDGRSVDPGMVLDTSPRTTSLNSFSGTEAGGEWTLFLADLESGGTNLLVSWELEITGATQPTVTWPTPANIVYGTALGPIQLNASSPVAGTFSYSPPTGTVLNAGDSQPLTVVFTPSDLTAYASVATNISLNVLKAPLTVTAVSTNKVYGAAVPVLGAVYSGFTNGDTTSQLTSQAVLTTTATSASTVGSYPITPSGASSANYAITYVAGNLTVTPASLTITAVSTNKVYGAAVPVLGAVYSGFTNGDTTNQLTSQAVLTTTATSASPVGSYPITASGASSANYVVSYVAGTLTILKASTAGIVSSSKNPSLTTDGVTFTQVLSVVAPGVGIPTGTVQFRLNGANSGPLEPLLGGAATRNLPSLPAGMNTIVAEYAGDNNFVGITNTLSPNQVVNTPPVAGLDTIERGWTNGTKIRVSTLLSNDSDADGDTISFVSFAALSTNGAVITQSGDWISYTPAARLTVEDSFEYSIIDERGAAATGTVLVTVRSNDLPSLNLAIIDLGDGSYLIRFDGIPGKTYRVEYNENLETPSWQDLGSRTADEFGIFQLIDAPPVGSPQRYYRSLYP